MPKVSPIFNQKMGAIEEHSKRSPDEASHAAEALYRSYLTNTVEGIWRIEAEAPISTLLPEDLQTDLIVRHGYVAESNDAYARMHGFTRAEEMTGRWLRDLLARSGPQGVELLRTFVRTGYRLIETELCVPGDDGAARWFSVNLTGIVEAGHLARAWGSQRDVTQRQQRIAEEWQATFDAIRDPVLVVDCHHRIVRANAAALALFRLPVGKVVGRQCHALLHGAEFPWPRCPVAGSFATRRRVEAELFIPARGLWLHLAADPILDEAGNVTSVVHTLRDITERKTAEAVGDRQLRFERLIANSSVRLLQAPADRVNSEIETALREIREFLELDRTSLIEVGADQASVTPIASCTAPGSEPPLADRMDVARGFPWTFDYVIRRGQCLLVPTLQDLPPEAEPDRASYLACGIRSFLAIPLSAGASVEYVIAGVAVGREHTDLEEYIPRLRLLGDMLVNVLARQRAQRQVRESEDFNRTVLDSLEDPFAVLDGGGTILAVNEAWERFGDHDRTAALAGMATGSSYLRVCRRAGEAGDPNAALVLTGVANVIEGVRPHFACEYRCEASGEARWFEVVAQALRRPAGGAIVSHINITNKRRAEAEAQQLRDQLAHVARAAALGELVAALAHELNQPLTAILSNAQAAQRQLGAGRLAAAELGEILADIAADGIRAGEVIRRVRGALKPGPWQPQSLALNRLADEVSRMVRNEALLRQVTLALDLAPGLPAVQGDAIQLQQVLLNLIVNAMDALETMPAGERHVRIVTRQPRPGWVQVDVVDNGIGIAPEKLSGVFEPFFTTKPGGLGMGLAICRSILQTHHGTIEAATNPDRGATLRFALPAFEDASP